MPKHNPQTTKEEKLKEALRLAIYLLDRPGDHILSSWQNTKEDIRKVWEEAEYGR